MKKINIIILGIIILVAAFLRIYRLGNDGHPLLWDEAALGYNAYSLGRTLADEYGQKLPIVLKSFGDYKPPLYAYLLTPFVSTLGLTEFSTRLLSAISGVFTVLLVGLVAQQLFYSPDSESKTINPKSQNLAPNTKYQIPNTLLVCASLLAAFNPWLIHFSRGAWEANLNLMLTLLGIWLFLKARFRIKYLIISGVVFALTFLTYQGAKLFTPLIILGLITLWGKQLFLKDKKISLMFIALSFSTALLTLLVGFGQGNRLGVMSVFAYPRSPSEVAQIAQQDNWPVNSAVFQVVHGEWFYMIRRFLEGYFNHFSGRFLFYEGDWSNKRLGSPYVGEFYWPDLLLLGIGLAVLIRRAPKKPALFLGYWLVIAPLPSALSRDIIQAVRSLNLAIPMLILSALGLCGLMSLTLKHKKILILCLFLVPIYLFNIAYYLDLYFVHAPILDARDMLYGYKEAVLSVSKYTDPGTKLVFTQKYGQPYIYYLFYNRIDPKIYQPQAKLTENPYGDVGTIDKLGNIEFRNIYWPGDRGTKNTVFVGTEEELPTQDLDPKQVQTTEDIRFPDGGIAFRIVKTKN